MKRYLLVLLVLPLAAVPARAQQHQHPASADTTHSMQMGGMKMDANRMMQMHARMMQDSVIRRHMRADTATQSLTRDLMGGRMQMSGMGRMDAAAQKRMMAQMRQRMQGMTPEQRQALTARMMAAHHRLMAAPEVRARMIADPEMKRMMGGMEMKGMHNMGADTAGTAGSHKH